MAQGVACTESDRVPASSGMCVSSLLFADDSSALTPCRRGYPFSCSCAARARHRATVASMAGLSPCATASWPQSRGFAMLESLYAALSRMRLLSASRSAVIVRRAFERADVQTTMARKESQNVDPGCKSMCEQADLRRAGIAESPPVRWGVIRRGGRRGRDIP